MAAHAVAAGRARRPIPAEAAFLAGLGLFILVLCIWPLAKLLATVFDGGAGPGLAFLADIWSTDAARTATANTLWAAGWATLVSLTLGGGMALLVSLVPVRGRGVLVFLVILPLLIPPQISTLAWLSFMGPQSPVWTLPGLAAVAPQRNPLLGAPGIILVMGLEHAPLVFLSLRAGLRALPADLLDAARMAGAPPLAAVRGVVVPLMLPSLLAGALLAFVSGAGNFGVPALLGIPGRYPMLTTLIYQRLAGFGPSALPEVAALALILAAIALAGVAVQALAMRRVSVALRRDAGVHPGFAPGRAATALGAAAWALMIVVAVLPLCALVAAALVPSVGMALGWQTVTLDNLVYVVAGLGAAQRAFVNSLVLAGTTALVTMALAVPLAWLIVARRSRLARGLGLLADLPYVLPGIVLSIGVILAFLPPLPGLGESIYNTIWILLVAYLARFFALALRPVIAALTQIDPALEEAARMVGVGAARRLRAIVVPLLAPALGAGAILVFLGAFSELTVSALLWSQGSETVGVMVFSLYDEGNPTAAAAVSVWVLAIVLALAALASALARHLPEGVLPWQS